MRVSNQYVENGSYLRFQNITLGYNVPSEYPGLYKICIRDFVFMHLYRISLPLQATQVIILKLASMVRITWELDMMHSLIRLQNLCYLV